MALGPGEDEIARFYCAYLDMIVKNVLLDKAGLYEARCDNECQPGKPGFIGIAGNILPRYAHRIAPEIAEIIARSAHVIDEDVFAAVRNATENEFTAGADQWLWNRDADAMALEMVRTGGLSRFLSHRFAVSAIRANDLLKFAQTHLRAAQPSLIAEGDASRLHSRAEFEAMLRQAMQPPAPAASAAPVF